MTTPASRDQAEPSDASRPTLAAVAARAGVSASTASLAFSGAGPVSDATRERVLAAARELGYAGPDPRAQSLRLGRSRIIGVVIEDRLADAFRDPVNIAMLDGVSDELGSAGYSLLLLTDTGDGIIDVAHAPMDGVILIGCSRDLDEQVRALQQRGIPVVTIEAAPIDGVLSIDLDNRDASARAARHLARLGHEHVTVVTLPLGTEPPGPLREEAVRSSRAHTTVERLLGVREVFPDAIGVAASGSSVDAGLEAGRAVLAAGQTPTAIVAQSDLLALGVIRALEEAGLAVPADVSVVGFDGIRLEGAGEHELTTLVQPALDKGRAAGRAVVALVEGDAAEPRTFESTLRLGTTTDKPRRL